MNTGETIALIKAFGSGSSLPSVTSADNGKVLAVENGAWAAQANDVVLNATVAYDGSGANYDVTITSVCPSAEDLEAYFSEKRSIVLHITNGAWDARLYPELKEADTGYGAYYTFVGEGLDTDRGKLKFFLQFNENNGSVTYFGKVYIGDKFTITLTPTALDYSGTMSKTPTEISLAYVAGMEIVFDIPSLHVKAHAFEFAIVDGDVQAGAVVTFRTGSSDLLIEILTDASTSTYATHIYSLTPAS